MLSKPKNNPSCWPAKNGTKKAIIEIIIARLLAFLTSFMFISMPARNIRKNTASPLKTEKASVGWKRPKSDGPKIIPANSSPTSAGCFILRNNSPKSFATTNIITIPIKNSSTCN